MTPLERAAQAAFENDTSRFYFGPSWDDLHPLEREQLTANFGAGLETLLDPSWSMVCAGIGPMMSEDEEQAGRTFKAILRKVLEATAESQSAG